MGTLATRLVLLPPKDPQSEGIVERRNGELAKERECLGSPAYEPERPD
jgi:hypothetical protein